jgi:hypothetical protein
MGTTFKLAEKYLKVDTNTVFVEIGSDRYEGSTEYFAELAQDNNTILHTVDLSNEARNRLDQTINMQNIVWHQATGSDWAKNVFPTFEKKISLLYLDNFDYNWNISRPNDNIELQKTQYREEFGIEMTNQNCQLEHFKQMLSLYPYMADYSIIICDDTYTLNDCWIGKCGPIVVYLLANGYQIVEKHAGGDAGYSYGVILVRG